MAFEGHIQLGSHDDIEQFSGLPHLWVSQKRLGDLRLLPNTDIHWALYTIFPRTTLFPTIHLDLVAAFKTLWHLIPINSLCLDQVPSLPRTTSISSWSASFPSPVTGQVGSTHFAFDEITVCGWIDSLTDSTGQGNMSTVSNKASFGPW